MAKKAAPGSAVHILRRGETYTFEVPREPSLTYRCLANRQDGQGLTPARTSCREILVGSSNPGPELTVQSDFLQEQAKTLFPSATTTATSRPVAGVTIPDSKLAHEVTELVKDTESPLLFHHELSPNFGDGLKDQAAAWA